MRALLQARFILISLILLTLTGACAKRNQEQIRPGTTTSTGLRTALGAPMHTWIPQARPQAKLLHYPDGCTFQVEHDVVIGAACPPIGDEGTLQYWRHKWAGHSQKFEELPGTA